MTAYANVHTGDRVGVDRDLVVTECWCGIVFAIPSNRERWMRESDSNGCHCPEGHTFIYSDNREKQRQRELQAAKDRAARLAADRDQAEASARAYKGVATKARKRAGAGVCPCCNRTFKQLARHMKTKHPDFEPDPDNEKAAASSKRPAA